MVGKERKGKERKGKERKAGNTYLHTYFLSRPLSLLHTHKHTHTHKLFNRSAALWQTISFQAISSSSLFPYFSYIFALIFKWRWEWRHFLLSYNSYSSALTNWIYIFFKDHFKYRIKCIVYCITGFPSPFCEILRYHSPLCNVIEISQTDLLK